MEAALWDNRKHIWGHIARLSPLADRMAERYFRQRRLTQDLAHPTWRQLQRTLLRASGSAPGIDDIPYEVLHVGCAAVTAIIGQAAYQAETEPDQIQGSLGPAHDLLIWIPKTENARTP
eukprot:2323204-Prorocentrum_lima.AAC.1